MKFLLQQWHSLRESQAKLSLNIVIYIEIKKMRGTEICCQLSMKLKYLCPSQNLSLLTATAGAKHCLMHFILTITCFWFCAIDMSANHTHQVWQSIILIFLGIDLEEKKIKWLIHLMLSFQSPGKFFQLWMELFVTCDWKREWWLSMRWNEELLEKPS